MLNEGLLINKEEHYSHNPNYDLTKLLQWVQDLGHIFTSELKVNAFGI